MKRLKSNILMYLVTLYLVTLTGCNKPEDTSPAPALPQAVSIDMDGLSTFSSREKSASSNTDSSHYRKAWKYVHTWDSTSTSFVRIPKLILNEALHGNNAVYNAINDEWTWTYTKSIAGNGEFRAILTGKITEDSIYWTMTVSSVNNSELINFKWLEGQTDLKQTGGWWRLYEPYTKEAYLMINWGKESDAIKWIQYTNISHTGPNKGNSIKYGTTGSTDYNAYFNISMVTPKANLKVEWNKTTFAGRLILGGSIYGWDSNLNSLDDKSSE